MPKTIRAHGGNLMDRFLLGGEKVEARNRAGRLPAIRLNPRQISDLELIATGAASPLTGFMARHDYESVVREMHLANGLPWA